MKFNLLAHRKWFYPVVYILLIIISALPVITEIPYAPQDTRQVIIQILFVSLVPYRSWGWIFHVATLLLIPIIIAYPKTGGLEPENII